MKRYNTCVTYGVEIEVPDADYGRVARFVADSMTENRKARKHLEESVLRDLEKGLVVHLMVDYTVRRYVMKGSGRVVVFVHLLVKYGDVGGNGAGIGAGLLKPCDVDVREFERYLVEHGLGGKCGYYAFEFEV